MKAILTITIASIFVLGASVALAERVPARTPIGAPDDSADSDYDYDDGIGGGGHEPIDFGYAPRRVKIKKLAVAGSGCKNRPKAKLLGNQLLQLNLGRLEAASGPYIPRSDFREFCQVAMTLDYPAGWTYAVKVAETKIQGYLERGVKGSAGLVTYFQGERATSQTSVDLRGPTAINHTIAGPLHDTDFAPCGESRAINIKQQVMVRGSRRAF